ncbi:CAP domain-containing protein [Patescibacteria group bacterium]|nr:CAP domain-containing protein [Patescibacteria group bacterium]
MGHILRHLLMPHETNNHRARVLHPDALFLFVLVFAGLRVFFGLVHAVDPNVLGYATDIRIDALLADTNAAREANGLQPLSINGELDNAAAAKAQDMFANNYWAHQSPEGKTPWDFIVGSGYSYALAGENLAKNFSTSQAVVDAWMASPSHRENMLKTGYRDIGFAVVNGTLNGEETTLVVQMFGATPAELAGNAPTTTAKTVALAPTPVPTNPTLAITPVPAAAVKAVEVPSAASFSHNPPVVSGFSSVLTSPALDITGLNRLLVAGFLLFLLTVLFLDAWLAGRRRLVRVTGHSVGHLLFLGVLFVGMAIFVRGSIL